MPLQLTNASVFDLRPLTPEQAQAQYGLRVLVMRNWPRGVRRTCVDLWVPDAGPSKPLLNRYNSQEIEWEQFKDEYIQEQAESRGGRLIIYPRSPLLDRIETRYPVRPVALLAWWARRQQTTLLCWERSGNCHRHALQTLVEQAVVDQAELAVMQSLPELSHGLFQFYGGNHG
jgi:Protein of unknown function, DUF488